MGISMQVSAVEDADLRAFQADPAKIAQWKCPAPAFRCLLHNHWRTLDDFLIGRQPVPTLPLSALRGGEVAFPAAADPAHAIFSPMARRFEAEIRALAESDVRRYFANKYPRSGVTYPGLALSGKPLTEKSRLHLISSGAAEIGIYLRMLQKTAATAAAYGTGLLFQKYEDW